MKKIPLVLMSSLVMHASLINAQNVPVSFSSDARIKHVTYQENNVIPIHGVALTTTQITFGENEEVLDIEGGDTSAWMVTYHPHTNMVFVKPSSSQSDSNITVITNRHHYYFHVTNNKSVEKNQASATYAVKILYPEVPKIQSAPTTSFVPSHQSVTPRKEAQKINWDYRFSGSPELVPLHVFDDGKFTYFELARNAPVPAIFAVDDKRGKEMTVNTRHEKQYIVVQRLAPQFTLRNGAMVTSVFNVREISRIQQNQRPQS